MAVNKTSQATRIQIRDKTSYALPNNPSKALMQPNQIKNYLGYLAMLDVDNSIMSELDRIVDETNGILNNDNERIETLIADVGDKTNLTTEQKTNLVNAINELVTAIGTIRTSVNNANARVDDLYRFLADNGLDNDTIISNVNEILAFITTLPETKTLVEYLDEKADKTSLNDLKAQLEAIADSDDTTLDQFTELINFIRTKAGASELASGLAGKVDKVDGKGLSTNDYDDTEKAKVLANTNARHSHSNKGTLDQIQVALTTAMKNGFDTTDQKSLYNLGAYDSVTTANGITTITRQTGYKKASELLYGGYVTTYNLPLVWCNMPSDFVGTNLDQTNDVVASITKKLGDWTNLTPNTWRQWDLNKIAFIFPSGTTESQAKALLETITLQYKLATSYTEQVIEGQPLNTLDQNESQILKDDIDNGLNLCETPSYNGTMGNAVDSTISLGKLKATTYTLSLNVIENSSRTIILYFFNNGVRDTSNQITTTINSTGYKAYTFTINSSITYDDIRIGINDVSNSVNFSNIMLNEGTHSYPYVPYNANKHISNAQADLLKDEFDRCSNLLPSEYVNYDSQYTNLNTNLYLKKGTYTISYSNITMSTGQWQILLNDNIYATKNLTQTSITFDVSSDNTKFYIYCNQPMPNAKFMLNEGDTALPYKEYEGKIVHEKDLNSLIARIVALENR